MRDLYNNVMQLLHDADSLEKQASETADIQDLIAKTAHDVRIFELIKTAALGSLAPAAKTLGKGALVGAGAAIPATIAGQHLIGKADEAASRQQEDLRNKALQVALGVGGIGAGLMGMHHLVKRPNADTTEDAVTPETQQALLPYYDNYKTSSALEKLATTGYLDTMLEAHEKYAGASECRALNAEYSVHLLRQLLA